MEEKEGEVRIFTEEDYRMQRIHQLKDEINKIVNPLEMYMNQETGTQLYGYQIILQHLNSMLAEIDFELTPEQKKKVRGLKNLIDIKLITEKTKPHSMREDEVSHTKTILFKKNNWIILNKLLFNYKTLVYQLEKAHSPKNKPKEFSYK